MTTRRNKKNPWGLPSIDLGPSKDVKDFLNSGVNTNHVSNMKKNSQGGHDRDARRSFTETQKNQILHQQNNKCARCHEQLDPRAKEFDHVKPWADKGRTIVQNGAALCRNCHGIKTHNTRLSKVDKKRVSRNKSSREDNIFGRLGNW